MFVKMNVAGITIDPFTNAPIVILKDEKENNTLPIWIGVMEASAIAAELEKMEFSRPMTHDLIASVVKNMSLKVLKVEIVDIKDNVYYATLHVDNGEEIRKIDSRPSDAIAVALRTSAPIFVHEDVLKNSKHIKFDQDAIKKGLSEGSSLDVLEELSPDAFGKYKM